MYSCIHVLGYCWLYNVAVASPMLSWLVMSGSQDTFTFVLNVVGVWSGSADVFQLRSK